MGDSGISGTSVIVAGPSRSLSSNREISGVASQVPEVLNVTGGDDKTRRMKPNMDKQHKLIKVHTKDSCPIRLRGGADDPEQFKTPNKRMRVGSEEPLSPAESARTVNKSLDSIDKAMIIGRTNSDYEEFGMKLDSIPGSSNAISKASGKGESYASKAKKSVRFETREGHPAQKINNFRKLPITKGSQPKDKTKEAVIRARNQPVLPTCIVAGKDETLVSQKDVRTLVSSATSKPRINTCRRLKTGELIY